jgi:hypothetical protein
VDMKSVIHLMQHYEKTNCDLRPRIYITCLLLNLCLCAFSQSIQKTDSALKSLLNFQGAPTVLQLRELESSMRKNITDSFLSVKNSLVKPVIDDLKKPIVFNSGQVSYSGNYDSSYFFSTPFYLNYAQLTTDWTIAGIPLKIDYSLGNWPGMTNGYFSTGFDKDQYIDQLKNKLHNKINPKLLAASFGDPLLELKNSAMAILKSDLTQINQEYKGLLTQDISSFGDLDSFFSKDVSGLKNNFLNPDVLQSIAINQNLFDQLQSNLILNKGIDTVQYNQLKTSIARLEGLKKIIEVIERHRQSWQSSGLLSRIKQWDDLKLRTFSKIISDPSTVTALARNQLNLNSIQRFFLKINRFNIGANSLSSSSLSMQNFLNNGLVTEYLNKGKSAMVYLGKSMEGSSVLDMPFSNTVFANSFAKGVQLGKKSTSGASHFSITSFDEGFNSIGNLAGLNRFKRSLVTTINKEFLVGKYGIITTEISRSVSNYNLKEETSDKNSLQKMLSGEDLASNTSFDIQYHDEFPVSGLFYQVHIKKTALGYDNPGNPYLNVGGNEAGLTIRKTFLSKRLIVSARNDIKEFSYGHVGNDKWRNIYSVLDIKWKLKKGQFISLRYLPNQMTRIDDLGKRRVSTYNYLSVDGNLSKKISNSYYNNYFSFFQQKNLYVFGNVLQGANSLGFVSNQTVSIKQLLIYCNTQYNHSANNSQLVYFNSNFNTEIGSSYSLFRTINLSTSVSYNAFQNWYKQVGLRQSVSVLVNEKFDVNMFVDTRKNLKLYQPLIFGLVRGNVEVHYKLK